MHVENVLKNDPAWEYQTFDVVAVAACVFAPAIMWAAELWWLGDLSWPRGSISSYHDVTPAGSFYIPLTVAVMLFVVNGWIEEGHRIHVVMGALLLGVIVFDHDGATAVAHFAFAVYFFLVGAFLEAVRDSKLPSWKPWTWVLMIPILPFWLLVNRGGEIVTLWRRAAEIIAPFAALGAAAAIFDGWIDDHWLFIAEWIALTVLVVHYLADVQRHAHERHRLAVEA